MAVALEIIENINIDELLRITGFLDEEAMDILKKMIINRDFKSVRDLIGNLEKIDSRSLIRQLIENLNELKFKKKNYNQLISYFGEIDYRISQGADEKLQIIALVANIIEKLT